MFLMILINVLQVIISLWKKLEQKIFNYSECDNIRTRNERRLKNIFVVFKRLQTVSQVPRACPIHKQCGLEIFIIRQKLKEVTCAYRVELQDIALVPLVRPIRGARSKKCLGWVPNPNNKKISLFLYFNAANARHFLSQLPNYWTSVLGHALY